MKRGGICLSLALGLFVAAPALSREWNDAALRQLEAAAQDAPQEGLPLESASLEEIAALTSTSFGGSRRRGAEIGTQIDAVADALFVRLATDFAVGRIDPSSVDPEWHIKPESPDIPNLKQLALATGRVKFTLEELLPHHSEYLALRAELGRVSTEPDDEEKNASGFTREERLGKLRAAMERWRWMWRALPERRLEVHVPEFHVVLIQNSKVVRTNHVIVGRTVSPTPSFSAIVEGVVLNPPWEVPLSITNKELAPKFKRDPSAAARGNFEVLDAHGHVVDPASVDWGKRPLDVRVRQRPGPHNSLGVMKFDMPNPYAIYLHDTPAQSLFNRSTRAFSHGCIRVEGIRYLALAMLNSRAWDPLLIDNLIDAGFQTEIDLSNPMPIFVLYLTAGTNDDGKIAYVADVYRRDGPILNALDRATQEAARIAPLMPAGAKPGAVQPRS